MKSRLLFAPIFFASLFFLNSAFKDGGFPKKAKEYYGYWEVTQVDGEAGGTRKNLESLVPELCGTLVLTKDQFTYSRANGIVSGSWEYDNNSIILSGNDGNAIKLPVEIYAHNAFVVKLPATSIYNKTGHEIMVWYELNPNFREHRRFDK